jgi:site-specific DNA-adenine methylase
MYKDKENGFIYIDPPYLDSYNAKYNSYSNKQIDDKNNVIDETNKYIYIDLLEYSKFINVKYYFQLMKMQ